MQAGGFQLSAAGAHQGLRANALGAPIILSPTRLSPSAGGLMGGQELNFTTAAGLNNILSVFFNLT